MPKPETLKRIERDIAAGNLGKARDRLHGLILSYPEDLSLRFRLAEVYRQLQYPAMAGRYWYLEEQRTEEMRQAVAEFERECGNEPWLIANRQKIRFEPEGLPPGHARDRLTELTDRCKRKYGQAPDFSGRRGKRQFVPENVQSHAVAVGCILTFVVLAFLVVMGIMHVLSWFW